MLNENSLMADIALEAKDLSEDVVQIELAIEASVKHVDNSVVNIDLGGVSEFIDDYPIPKPEVAEGYVGFAVDTSKNEYDVNNIFVKQSYTPAQEEFFQYNGKVTMPGAETKMYMFSEAFNLQNVGKVLVYSGVDGAELKRVTLDYNFHSTFMFYGNDIGYKDLYMVGCLISASDSRYRIECYDSEGNLHSTVFLKSLYNSYQGFTFDGEYFYGISTRTSAPTRFLDKYNSDGAYIGSVQLTSNEINYVNVTANYILCSGNTAYDKFIFFTKDLIFVSDIANISTSDRYSESVSLLGFNCVYIRFNRSVVFIDLINKKATRSHFEYYNVFISYFKSHCLLASQAHFYKLDYEGNKFDIVNPKPPVSFNALASNGSMIMGLSNSNGYSYTDLADKELACLAKKRG